MGHVITSLTSRRKYLKASDKFLKSVLNALNISQAWNRLGEKKTGVGGGEGDDDTHEETRRKDEKRKGNFLLFKTVNFSLF